MGGLRREKKKSSEEKSGKREIYQAERAACAAPRNKSKRENDEAYFSCWTPPLPSLLDSPFPKQIIKTAPHEKKKK